MAFIPSMGPLEWGILLVVVLLLFGPKRLPQLGKSIGKTVKAIREGVDGKNEEEAEEAAPVTKKAKVNDDEDGETSAKTRAKKDDEAEV